jgi:cell division protein ZapD
MEPNTDWVVFEQPLTERVRAFLRLEFLFDEYAHFRADTAMAGARAAMKTFLDILSVIGRSDLRTDLMKDFAEQIIVFTRLRTRPQVDHVQLDRVLADLRNAGSALQKLGSAHPSQLLRENEFLFAVQNRSAIPGGTCAFDLPAYHRWLSRAHADVAADIASWSTQLQPFEQAIRLYLHLMRNSTQASDQVAEGGVFLHTPPTFYPLIRVLVPAALDVYPEVSAGKHRISIRFMSLGNINVRNLQAVAAIPFRLQLCSIRASHD